jgi:transcriptional regulator with XRE-family HTH domain
LNSLGSEIRRLREKKGLLLRQMASFLEVDTAIMSKLERGDRNFQREQVIKLAEFLDTNADSLLVLWLADKIDTVITDDPLAVKALNLVIETKRKKK